jgi:hypothetical protein
MFLKLRDVSSYVEDVRGSAILEEAGRCGGGCAVKNTHLRVAAFVRRAAEAELDGESTAVASSRS